MPNSKRQLQLLGTSGCHLCDLAEALLVQCLDMSKIEVELIDIADDEGEGEDLIALYGIKIPVLRCTQSQKVLCWPFDALSINAF
jgi:hypothetical protein